MLTNRWVLQLIQQVDYAFCIDLKDTYMHIPMVKHCHHILHLAWKKTLSVKDFAI